LMPALPDRLEASLASTIRYLGRGII
jgi:hypothetical protein